ncbi:MAG: hypothetical protein JWR61_1114 [Ferruginibacter sp.]|uniref:hypothetical protein n=1 Tax=Ferruginibacter sp. TaxID=1940288 RepID=UPI00265A62B7|nr:hypothetical protein [Ferruginibacter sp.]MDB5276159.1 hypothetical protein [Ferruginibacter sp.]
MNKISFKILPSSETNDHEIRVLIDNEDFLGDDYLGLDPPSFFEQDNFDKDGELMIGRCTCGVEGCCDYPVTVAVNQNTILWTNHNGLNLAFDKQDYDHSIGAAKNDYSWEDIKRKVERLTTNVLKKSQTKDNYNFNWASARIKDKQITLSYSKNGDQKMFDIAWDGQSDTNVEDNAKQFFKDNLKAE